MVCALASYASPATSSSSEARQAASTRSESASVQITRLPSGALPACAVIGSSSPMTDQERRAVAPGSRRRSRTVPSSTRLTSSE